MPKFVIERELTGAGKLPRQELQAISQKSCGVLRDMGPQIQWQQSFVTDDKIYCIYIAPDEDAVKTHAAQGRLSGQPHFSRAGGDRPHDGGSGLNTSAHSREGGNPDNDSSTNWAWIPAFAGVSGVLMASHYSIGTIAASFELRSVSEVFTLRTFGAAVSFSTKAWKVFRSGATHLSTKSISPESIQHSRTNGWARTKFSKATRSASAWLDRCTIAKTVTS